MRFFTLLLMIVVALCAHTDASTFSIRYGLGMLYHSQWGGRFYIHRGSLDDVLSGKLVKRHTPRTVVPVCVEIGIGVSRGRFGSLETAVSYSGYSMRLRDQYHSVTLFYWDIGMDLQTHRATIGLRYSYGEEWSVSADAAFGVSYTCLCTWDYFRNFDGDGADFYEQLGSDWNWTSKFGLAVGRKIRGCTVYVEGTAWLSPSQVVPVSEVRGGERVANPELLRQPTSARNIDLSGLQFAMGISVPF